MRAPLRRHARRLELHDAVADDICELLYAHLNAGDDADSAVVAVGLRDLVSGTVAAATVEEEAPPR